MEQSKQEQEVKERKLTKTSPSYCGRCIYHDKSGDQKGFCTYLLDTGKRRGCPIGYCDKFEQKNGRRRKVKA